MLDQQPSCSAGQGLQRYKVHSPTGRGELAQRGPLSQPHVYSSLPFDDALCQVLSCKVLHDSQFFLFLNV